MSTKLTPSQIKKIIKEELDNILLEASYKNAEEIFNAFNKWAKGTKGLPLQSTVSDALSALEQMDISDKDFGKALSALKGTIEKLKRAKPDSAEAKRFDDLYDRVSEKFNAAAEEAGKKTSTPTTDVAKSNLGLKAAGAGAVAAGAALMSMDPEEIVKDSDATQLQSLPPEKLASFPEDELSNLPPEKQEIVKQKIESAKARRTRIAHLAIAAKNAKDSVIKLQSRLGALGYSLGKYGVDGDYGPATVKAVKDFQWANDLVEDGIVGKNTWKVLSGQGAQGPGKTGKGAGAGDGEGLGAELLSSLRSMDKNDEKLKYVYNATRVALTKALEEQGVPNRAAFNTAQGYLPPVTPNPYGNTMDVVKEKRILAISNLLKKGIKVRLGDKDIVLSPKAIYDSLKAAIARGEALKEGIALSLVFNNQTRLLD